MNSIHSPADSLVLSSSFHSIESLSPPSTPGRKRLYYPDQLSPMPEFFSSNGSLLSVDHLLVELEVTLSEEEEAEYEAKQVEQMARRPLPSFTLHPKSSSAKMNMKLQLDQLDQIKLPYSEPSPAPPTHHRMACTSSLPRLPSLSEHNNVRSSSANEFMLKPEHDDNDDNKHIKLPAIKRKGMERKQQSEDNKRSSLVARCA
mmetsp:Transcript_22279/g.28539  ORF Transcript_22279/g.28539 Transcript_22279/m.28539 type:complete len:202 (-) Transcript_22279:568-1173(-)